MSNEINTPNGAAKEEKFEENNIEDDYVVKSIGGFGVWQAVVTVSAALTRFMPIWNIQSILFLTPPTEFTCVKFKDNATTLLEVNNTTCYDNCVEYKYSQEVFEETLISKFGLICDNAWMASFAQTVLMFGLFMGIFVFGWISDRFGRSNAIIISGFMSVVFMFIAPFCPDYWSYTCLRFLIGLASGGIVSVTIVMSLENVSPKLRYEIGCMVLIPDGIAMGTLAIFAYYTTTWKRYMLSYAVVSVPILVIILFLPETPRWLMANGNPDKAVALITKAAKMNKREVDGIQYTVNKSIENMMIDSQPNKMTYLDLFRTRELAVMTTSSVIMWFIVGFTFYGLNQYLALIATDTYVVVGLLGAIMMVSCPLTVLISRFFARKTTTIISLVTVGITMSCLIFIPEDTWATTLVGIIGITAGNVAFVVIYIYVTELYPTTMRNMGCSFSSSGSKLGAMIAPFVANLRPQWIAALIFAVLPFIAIVFCCLLPETKGKTLKDTL